MQTLRIHPRLALRLGLFALLVAPSCSGGGGGGSGGSAPGPGPGPGGGLDQGSFTIADFAYQDTDPAGFHPLGIEGTRLLSRAELALFVPLPGTAASPGWVLDDPAAGHAQLYTDATLFQGGVRVAAIAAGELDGDADQELAMLLLGASAAQLVVLSRNPVGQLVPSALHAIPGAYASGSIALGDFDGDLIDEFAVATRSQQGGFATFRVFGAPSTGFALLHSSTYPNPVQDLAVVAAQLDTDPAYELALYADAANQGHVRVLDDAESGFATIQDYLAVAETGLAQASVISGDVDGDGIDELNACWIDGSSNFPELRVRSYERNVGGLVGGTVGVFSLGTFFAFEGFPPGWSATAFDPNGQGHERLAVITAGEDIGSPHRLRYLARSGSSASWTQTGLTSVNVDNEGSSVRLVAGDDNADGAQELYAGFVTGTGSIRTRRIARFGPSPGAVQFLPTVTFSAPGANQAPAMALFDLDADGLALRSTGLSFLTLSDPMPIAVLAAPPTKAGISQSYALSSTSYGVGTSNSTSFGVTTGVTASVYQGFEIDDLFDAFGVSARRTLEVRFETTEVETEQVTLVQEFSGAHGDDVVLFQGTLNKSYEYEIIGAPEPTLLGTYFTIDVPVATKVYKWTVPYFNSTFAPRHGIGPDVLSHTIGDPASYPTPAELDAQTSAYVGWASQPLSTGQGSGSNAARIELEQELATIEQRTFSVDHQLGFKAGGATFGGSFGISTAEIYTVTVSATTYYVGTVGDIALPADYAAWHYDFALSIHHRGVLADGSNEPIGFEQGTLPFQVVTYAVTPTGSAF